MNENLKELCEFFERLNSNESLDLPKNVFYISEERIPVSLQDVEIFNEYLRKHGGHTGSWEIKEHNIYLQWRKKHNLTSIIYLLRLQFPDISEEEIMEHDTWYTNYIKLKEAHQRALKFWRLKKEKKKNLEKSIQTDQNRTSLKLTNKTNENVKFKIQNWKEYKKQLKDNEQRVRQIADEIKAKKEEIIKAGQENKKKIVMQYKKEKQESMVSAKISKMIEENETRKIKAKYANKIISSYREKDLKFIREMQTRRDNVLRKASEKQSRLEFLALKNSKNVRVERNRIRLLIPTVEWRQKMNNSRAFFNNHSRPFTSIMNIEHLGVPEWRRELKQD